MRKIYLQTTFELYQEKVSLPIYFVEKKNPAEAG